VDDLFWYAVGGVDWASYPTLPAADGGRPNSVPAGLHRIEAVTDVDTARAAVDFALDAVGDQRAGRVFPVLLPALPFLLHMAVAAEPWSRYAATQVVIDVLGWAPEGLPDDRAQIVRRVRPWQRRLEAQDLEPQQLRVAVRELLAALDG
jgi:hypothetical protein